MLARRSLSSTAVAAAVIVAGVLRSWHASAIADDAPPKPAAPANRLPRVEDFAPPEEFLVVNGIKTHLIRKGDAGPEVVLIHGFGSSTYTWRKNVDVLAKDHRVVAIDLKGFGLTEKPRDGRYDFATLTRHLEDTIDALKFQRPVLVGNSMGGMIALRAALRRPDRVRALVLVDAAPLRTAAGPMGRPAAVAPKADPAPATKPGNPVLANLKSAFVRAAITRGMVESGLKSSFKDPSLVTPEMVDVYYRPLGIEGGAEALMAMGGPPPAGELPLPPISALKAPTLIVWGRYDRVIPVKVADEFEKSIPGARKVIFENSGHLPHEEEPDAFNPLLTRFIAQTP